MRECAKTLDSLHIPPCGHRARENRALVKVFASCQPDQEATEPGYSVEAVTVEDDGSITYKRKKHFIKMFKDVGMVVPKIRETRL